MDRTGAARRPSYPSLQSSSLPASTVQSSSSSISSMGSNSSPNPTAASAFQDQGPQPHQILQQSPVLAPLPSPTMSHQLPFFPSLNPQIMQQQHQQYQQQQHQYQLQQHQYQLQQHQHQVQQHHQQQQNQQIRQYQYQHQQHLQQLQHLQHQQHQQHLQQLQQRQHQQQQQQGMLQMQSYQCIADRSGTGTSAQETASFIREYGLVAEAARRAQVAVLVREMEAVELS